MGKKRSRQPSSNGIIQEESSESDESMSHDKSQNSTRACQHANKSIDQNVGKKNLNLEDLDNNNFCKVCSKQGPSDQGEEVYVCLRCGEKTCSLEHSKAHNNIARSDPHFLALKLSNMTVWCHACASEVEISTSKKLKSCVTVVESLYEKHLQGPRTKTSPKIESIEPEENKEKRFVAVPVLPSKIKSIPNGCSVRGLCNLGNTCFFNSVLQCLARTPNLIETLQEMNEPKDVSIELKSGKTLEGRLEKLDHLCETLADTLIQLKCGGSSFSPIQLLNNLRRKVPQFRGSDQHDAHELLRHLLDNVRSSDLKRYRRIMLNELGLNSVDNNEKVDAEKTKELKQMDREVTEKVMLVTDRVFRGFLVSRLECQECHHSSECVESFLDLSLPVTSEKPHPPSFRRKGSPSSPEEKGGSHQMSKHQLKKERKLERKKNRKHHGPHNKKEAGQGESMPCIAEKGESDEEGDDGDVDSEESDRKTENCKEGGERETLCAGLPNPSGPLASSPQQRSEDTVSPGGIPLTGDGVPDISRLNINDTTQPKLKIFVRDSATIAKENPSWRHHLLELSDSKNHLLRQNSNHLMSVRDIIQEKLGNDEQMSPEDKLQNCNKIANGEDLADGHILSNEHNQSSLTDGVQEADSSQAPGSSSSTKEKDEAIKTDSPWDEENSSPPRLESVEEEKTSHNDEDKNSDDEEVMMGSLFDESNFSAVDSCGECSVQTCLSQFTGIELMTGSNKVGCETCTARANKGKKDGKTVYTMSTKQLLIAEAPPVLILHIKRFQVLMSSFRKLGRHVAFPLELDISPFCKKETVKKSPNKLLYSLYGLVEHSGNFNGGHYVAYVKVDDGQWFCISDSYVHEVKESRVLQVQAYLLFYKMTS